MVARRILHVDMDAFFASVEQVRDPSLRGKPLVVGGLKTDTRGVVLTASYEARPFGVHSAMPIAEAARLCPHGIFIRGNRSLYSETSRQVREILSEISPVMEMASIDEAYLDVTGCVTLYDSEDGLAAHLKGEMRRRLELPCTVAIAANRLVAKVAAGEGKPDGYVRVPPGEEAAYLRPLPVKVLPGVGPKTQQVLVLLGIATVGDLADMPERTLAQRFGELTVVNLKRAAQGQGSDVVAAGGPPKSLGRETTFEKDSSDWTAIRRTLAVLTERTLFALRAHQLEARCVTLKVRYVDFQTQTFSQTLPAPTAQDPVIADAVNKLVPKAQERSAPVRLIGMSVSDLVGGQHQIPLLEGKTDAQWERALATVDALRSAHGFDALRFGRSVDLAGRESQ